MLKKIYTIGIMGKTEYEFFDLLKSNSIDTVVDIRKVCGSRGSKYSFANKGRLRKSLQDMEKGYVIYKELSPSDGLLKLQHGIDKEKGDTTLTRKQLSPEYTSRYREETLVRFDPDHFIEAVGQEAESIALLCFEPDPNACHRSLVGPHIKDVLKSDSVSHL